MAGEVVVSDGDCDAAIRSPLQCRAGEFEVCPACVGMLMTGRPAQPGDAIGVLAAMLIGERSTQAAMKAFHAGGTHRTAVRATLHRTRARLGRGVLLDSDGAEWRLSSVFDHALSAEDHDAVLAAAESVGAEIARDLGVDPTLVAVVMRQLVDAARLRRTSGGGRDLVWWAERRGRGELDRLIGRGLPRSGVPLALYGPMGNPANGTGLARLSFATGLEVRA
jgi:hypothetical protein